MIQEISRSHSMNIEISNKGCYLWDQVFNTLIQKITAICKKIFAFITCSKDKPADTLKDKTVVDKTKTPETTVLDKAQSTSSASVTTEGSRSRDASAALSEESGYSVVDVPESPLVLSSDESDESDEEIDEKRQSYKEKPMLSSQYMSPKK